MKKIFNVGIDVGSTTVKIVVLDKDKVIFKKYTRHFSDVKKAVKEILQDVYKKLGDINISVVVTGSGGMDISNYLNLKFVQEVISTTKAMECRMSVLTRSITRPRKEEVWLLCRRFRD